MKDFINKFRSEYTIHLNERKIRFYEIEYEWLTKSIPKTKIERFRIELIAISENNDNQEMFVEKVAFGMEDVFRHMEEVNRIQYGIVRYEYDHNVDDEPMLTICLDVNIELKKKKEKRKPIGRYRFISKSKI